MLLGNSEGSTHTLLKTVAENANPGAVSFNELVEPVGVPQGWQEKLEFGGVISY